ncbi:hypothetical protein FVA18_04775 [Campylobacter jejuni]|uniref:hypothetical protein n=1 Tax=Campylobacter jejuni TaxID=197 RepID=UPI0009A57996|nr:hypothetical protein [Campylobacter jejuni]ECL3537061.1 hypothetical protein [Campylobacter jejuni]ECP5951497.1 hypothetical protein [Campylobacter jejuni]ECP9345280.1 hypothetical protein [Campylobacter jejuni]ECP9363321.1 hypothetical protein [Campylobacter jejuni]MEA8963887.1 hypothetical protein [Campylobacter jejuni]
MEVFTVKWGGVLDTTTPLKISNFDLSAIECALKIKTLKADCQIIGLYIGDLLNSKLSKDLLSRGLDELIHLKTPCSDSIASANILADYMNNIQADIILASQASSDLFQGVFAPYLAAKLDYAYANAVSDIEKVENTLTLMSSDALNEMKISVATPCVLSINPESFEAKIPGMKAILAAAKKPVKEENVKEQNSLVNCIALNLPKAQDRAKQIFDMKNIENFKAELEKLF